MFKSLMAIASLVVALSITAADNASVGVTAGYNNNYVVNGVVRNNASALIAVDASKTLKYADVYFKGTLLPTGLLVPESHLISFLTLFYAPRQMLLVTKVVLLVFRTPLSLELRWLLRTHTLLLMFEFLMITTWIRLVLMLACTEFRLFRSALL